MGVAMTKRKPTEEAPLPEDLEEALEERARRKAAAELSAKAQEPPGAEAAVVEAR